MASAMDSPARFYGIAPLAVALALSFWAPYTPDHQPPCHPPIRYFSATTPLPSSLAYDHLEGFTVLGGGCATPIWLRSDIGDLPVNVQCAVDAHELGHDLFALGHSPDPRSVMNVDGPVPGACVPPRVRPRGADARCRVRWWSDRTPIRPKACPKQHGLWTYDDGFVT